MAAGGQVVTAIVAPRSPSAAAHRRVPISVNGVAIPRAAVAREAQHHPAATPGASLRAAAEALVVRELLLQAAPAARLEAMPLAAGGKRETDEEALIRSVVDNAVRVPEPGEEELRRYYDNNRARFRSSELIEARHILVAAPSSDQKAYEAARRKAEAIADDLADDPLGFGRLARAHSDCASAGEGGWLGQLAPGDTTPEFAAAAAVLAEGETTRHPVETRYGFHIVRLERRIAGRELPFDAVAARIRDYLVERARRTATAQYIARLVSRSDITGIELAGVEAHRVSPAVSDAA
jgi:peptidyl-prolyl cis-trans isomerase C